MKRFVLRFLLIVMTALSATAAYNCKYDTSGVLNTNFSVKREEPNQHFVKVRYLIATPNKYDAYCFGSSRVGNINLAKINNEHRYYNMTYSQGVPEEWLADIQIFLKHNVEMKQILLGLDDFSYQVDPKTHETQSLRIPYRDDGNIKTYLSYLLKHPSRPSDEATGSIYDIYGSGRPLHPWVDEKIEQDVEAHIHGSKFPKASVQHKRFKPKVEHEPTDRMDETMEALREIKRLADERNIELIVFINPMYRFGGSDRFSEFQRRLASLTDYYDFSGINEITTNNYYYYETSHYRPLVGDMIVQRIFYPDGVNEFGAYVTQDNVEQHLRLLEKYRKQYVSAQERAQ